MASLLNMLNNFLGSAGKPSVFSMDSTNTSQATDFKSIVSKLLNGGEGDAQALSALLPDSNGGVDLPLLDAAGNALPPQTAFSLNIDASMQLPDIELAASASSVNGEELVALQTGDFGTGGTTAVTQQSLAGSIELAPTSGLEASLTASAPLTTPLSGGVAQVTGDQNPTLQNALSSALAPPNGDQMVDIAEADADTTQPVLNSSATEPVTLLSQAQLSSPTEVTAASTPVMMTLTTDGKSQLAASNDASASMSAPGSASVATSATSTAAIPAAQVSTQNTAQPAPQAVDVDAATLAAKDPQQFALEQALSNDAGSDNDTPAELTRQALVPSNPAPRAAPATATTLQATDPNFANIANMLNQGQSMNSLNDRLQLMLSNGQNSAEIQLDPPELGSLQVRVTTRNEQTQVIFVAPNNAVRDALEQQLPRLRETLENAGLQLQDANVFAQAEDKPGSQPHSYVDAKAAENVIADELEEAAGKVRGPRVSSQLVDAYI